RLSRLQHLDAAGGERIDRLPLHLARRCHYAFSAPDAMPLTNCRWNATKMPITGTIAITEAAKTSPQLVECWPWKSAIAIGRVRRFGSLITVRAQTNSSQLARKEKIATVASAGRESGRISWRYRAQGRAPSTTIASANARGMSWKKLRRRNVFSARFIAV